MARISILTALLSQLLCARLLVSGPCSPFFKYINDSATNDMMGQIQIPLLPKNVELHLKVAISNVSRSMNYTGQLELAQSEEESIRAVQEGRPLLYHLRFPLRQPIPLLTGLWINNRLYCSDPRATEQNVTSIQLEHTLYPPKMLPRNNSLPINYQTLDIYDSTFLSPSHLLAGGEKTMPGQWSWLVAIFVVKTSYNFICTGSILTNKHIITAAHCFKLNTQTNIPSSAIIVSLGRSRLHDFHEEESINKEIARYTIHPDYLYQETDSDLAILVLREPVEFSPLIKPIWIWNGPTELQSVVNKTGYVVGWGRNEFGSLYLEGPRITKASIVSQEVCLKNDSYLVDLTSNRTFCAAIRYCNSYCIPDSGSGLVIFNRTMLSYQLRGIVSRYPYVNCSLNYVVFVDVAKYVPWIQQQIST